MFLEQPVLLFKSQLVEAPLLPNLPCYFDHSWLMDPRFSLSSAEPDEAAIVVGVHQSLSGLMKVQIVFLTEKSDAWATTTLQGHLDQRIFWQGLHAMIWPSMHCPLVISSISEAAVAGIT